MWVSLMGPGNLINEIKPKVESFWDCPFKELVWFWVPYLHVQTLQYVLVFPQVFFLQPMTSRKQNIFIKSSSTFHPPHCHKLLEKVCQRFKIIFFKIDSIS